MCSPTHEELGLNGMLMYAALWASRRERARRMKTLFIPSSRARYQKGIRARSPQEEGLFTVAHHGLDVTTGSLNVLKPMPE